MSGWMSTCTHMYMHTHAWTHINTHTCTHIHTLSALWKTGGGYKLMFTKTWYKPSYICQTYHHGDARFPLSGHPACSRWITMSHGHSHGACGGDSDHSHDHPDEELGKMYSLYLKIDTERLQCLNEAQDGSGKTVFKPWDQRKDKEKVGTTFRALTQRLKGKVS